MEIRDNSKACPPTISLDPANLPFGKTFAPNMFMADWEDGKGWQDARIVPYANLSLAPSAMVFHYGQEIFEGLKGFRHADGSIWVFRPDRNAARFNNSARRMSMPEVPIGDHIEALRRLIAIDHDWVPNRPSTLYIRPTMIATEPALGVHSSKTYTFFIITGPTGPYFRTTKNTVRIMVARDWVRAAPGGTGAVKTGGNYAASLLAAAVAKQKGCDQVMWLDAVERRHVEEVGAMNLMFVIEGVVTTPPTSDRKSVV
jgi:branched-chain amino acid aminotransferase